MSILLVALVPATRATSTISLPCLEVPALARMGCEGGSITRASVGPFGLQANGPSLAPDIGAGGRYVAFASDATNLVVGDHNGTRDMFVHDLEARRTQLVSVGSSGLQGNAASGLPGSALGGAYNTISADGRFVAFPSLAANLVPGDTNGAADVFVRDRVARTTVRVSLGPGGTQANAQSGDVSISSDGRIVTFRSFATNLVAGDSNNAIDVFVHDLTTSQTSRVSVATGGIEADGTSLPGGMSADGRLVKFSSFATNLVPDDSNGAADVFVHDRATGETTRVSVGPAGVQSNGYSYSYWAMSADGRFITYNSYATNLVLGDTNDAPDVFVHDRSTGETSRVSVGAGGSQANGGSIGPRISGDGRYVNFVSDASNLSLDDGDIEQDTFLHDRLTGETILLSQAPDGTASSWRFNAAMSADGRHLAFSSGAPNLVVGDTNNADDVFVLDRGAP